MPSDTLTYSSDKDGMIFNKIDETLAEISWTPTNDDVGGNVVEFTVTDAEGLSDSEIRKRPYICIGDLGGKTLPPVWLESLSKDLERSFELPVSINYPFSKIYF